MVSQIIEFLTGVITQFISATGYAGVFFLMLLESCGIPIPSEIIMPFSGFLTATGKLSFWAVVIMGTLGNVAGSALAYYIAKAGGRPLIEKYGKFVLISKEDLDWADNWFLKRGDITVLVSRVLPVVRTYISFPAGAAKMEIKKFLTYTLIGSMPWSIALAYFGVKLENNWELISSKLHNFDLAIAIIVVLAIFGYIWHKTANGKSRKNNVQ